MRTKDEEIEQEFVSPGSVLLKDFHVDSRTDHEHNHEYSLRRYIDFLDGCST